MRALVRRLDLSVLVRKGKFGVSIQGMPPVPRLSRWTV